MLPARISRCGLSGALAPRSTSATCPPTRCSRWRRSGSACVRTRWASGGVADPDGERVYLARHGETDDNRPPLRFQGFRDTELNDTGRHQAVELARRAQEMGIVTLWSSDLRRALQTADIV